ncbi:LD-carboxypeptidase [Ferruginibacter yonginensis]|uniref:LD-carboxypeptidase n=1 Tax=Ferruginibacter yonginensis TaxID=1310416 RepID=A0ABV8QUB1_9BACT
MLIPPYLNAGDTIAITCPAGYMPLKNIKTCVSVLQKQGYKVVIGNTVGSKSKNYFSASDADRLAELQQFLDDKNIKAILCGRGGYGTGRIIEDINFSKFLKHPKWIIGFSDITILHTHLFEQYKTASLHASMAGAFNNDEYKNPYVQSLLAALIGHKAQYEVAPHNFNKLGKVKGKLIGGNLTLLAHTMGTSSAPKTKNCILFLEDLGEQLYHIDRMMYQLKRNGKLDELAGLIIGGFTDMKDTERPFGKTVYEIIKDIVAPYPYPVCFDFPVSHAKENYALKHGLVHELNISKETVTLKEL